MSPRSSTVHLPDSPSRFPDGAQYRVEVASVEGPVCLAAALEETTRLDVTVHRFSQGSGVFLHTDAELDEMAATAAAAGVEVSLFARPPAAWTLPSSPASVAVGAACAGVDGLADALADVHRAVHHGFRSVLVSDLGLLRDVVQARAAGELPQELQIKVSVMLPVGNPATATVLAGLGADTLNLPPFLTLGQIAEIRQAVDVPLDVYVEAPDTLGGAVRMHEIPELIRVAAPVYVKFGLRNAPDVYPAGTHIESVTVALTRERVRRARLGMELLGRSEASFSVSSLAAAGLAVPQVSAS